MVDGTNHDEGARPEGAGTEGVRADGADANGGAGDTPLKRRALALMDGVQRGALEAGLARADKATGRPWTTKAVAALFRAMGDADAVAATKRVERLRQERPAWDEERLVEHLIDTACRRTGAIGAASSGAAILPAIGTLTSLTVGVAADITLTFKLQAEMVLEIAVAYGFPMEAIDQRKLIFLVTGVSVGASALAERAGQGVATRVSERFAQRWLAHALPVIGVAASAGTNVVSTYVIGQRARAYFRHGPEAVADWKDALRALTGVDERRLARSMRARGGRLLGAVGARVGRWVRGVTSRDAAAPDGAGPDGSDPSGSGPDGS